MTLKSAEIYERRPFYVLKPKILTAERKSGRAVKLMRKAVKFAGVSEELQKILDAEMDQVGPRRRAREAFKDIQLSIDHILFKMPFDRLKMKESFEVNSRGLEIFSKSWLPDSSCPKAVLCFCHGYGDTCTFFFEGIARKLASSGYGVFAMDYPGFGLSEGLHGYIPKFDLIVNDVIEHYSKVKDDMVPPWLVTQILIGVANLLPKKKLVPQKDLAELAFRDVKKREQTAYNIVAYKHKPRLRTASNLERIEQIRMSFLARVERTGFFLSFSQPHRSQPDIVELTVSLPLLILHGKEDKVTDPSVSKALYEKARSQDKRLNLYDDAFHSLLEGEPDDMILKVFTDIISWLDNHC